MSSWLLQFALASIRFPCLRSKPLLLARCIRRCQFLLSSAAPAQAQTQAQAQAQTQIRPGFFCCTCPRSQAMSVTMPPRPIGDSHWRWRWQNKFLLQGPDTADQVRHTLNVAARRPLEPPNKAHMDQHMHFTHVEWLKANCPFSLLCDRYTTTTTITTYACIPSPPPRLPLLSVAVSSSLLFM